MMATAGGGTSRSAIAMALWWLHQFPTELARLKADPTLIDTAAEEFLRYDAPTQRGIRTAREDFDHRRAPHPQGPDPPYHDRCREP